MANGTLFVGSVDGYVYALDAETGVQHWRFETGRQVVPSPTVADGTVFVGSSDSHVYALDGTTGDPQWRFETGSSVHSSPTVVSNTVFVGSSDDHVYALDAGIDGSSKCSRTHLGTLGHHDQNVAFDEEIDHPDDLDADFAADEQLPGFGAGSALAGIGAAGYLLKRRLDEAEQ